ncbi:MAG: sigma-54 dependent transcriptional regulator [Waddliaceae bacterium]
MSIEKVLIIDDDEHLLSLLTEVMNRLNVEPITATSGKEGLALFKDGSFDLVFSDLKMPDITGIEVLSTIKKISPATLVVVMTGFGTIENAVEAMQLGAFHFIIKPFTPDTIEAIVTKAKEHQSLINENIYLRQEVKGKSFEVVGESPAMQQIIASAKQVAASNANVFIYGESGTGKEVIAQLVHSHSKRSENPFIRVNCAAIPESLIESEFFGHEKGAFTGASSKRLGRFELAHEGTLLLDEVTETPMSLQAKLLRAIQEGEFDRVGGSKPISVNVRIISTTNRDLDKVVSQSALREDLYYRLNVIPLHIPPLRERKEDILPLADFFLKKLCIENHKKKKHFTDSAKDLLLSYQWPGNVRELSNVIERAVVLSSGDAIDRDSLFINSPAETPLRS